ncbi:unnamed protein product, partial [Ectocarpus sp. 8 AP-2014]
CWCSVFCNCACCIMGLAWKLVLCANRLVVLFISLKPQAQRSLSLRSQSIQSFVELLRPSAELLPARRYYDSNFSSHGMGSPHFTPWAGGAFSCWAAFGRRFPGMC